jgi:hypothetical protein
VVGCGRNENECDLTVNKEQKEMTMKTIKKTFGIAACIGILAASATSVFAQVSTLAGLVANNGTLTIGDKTFSNFGWAASLGDAIELNAQAAGLTVSAFIGLDGVYYLDFAGGLVVNNLGGNSSLLGDLKLTYTVTANPGSINMIDQLYTPNATPASGQIIIGETVKNNQGIIVGNSTLTLNPTDLSDPQAEAGDNLNFTGEPQLFVVKDILIAANAGNAVGLSDVRQSFHQVPEPSAMLLGSLGGGLLLLLNLRGRQARLTAAIRHFSKIAMNGMHNDQHSDLK